MKGGARPGAGRKKGSGQAAHYRAMLEPYAEELIQRVVEMAKDGDMAALKLCWLMFSYYAWSINW